MKIVTFKDAIRDEFLGYYAVADIDDFHKYIVQHGTHVLKWKEDRAFLAMARLILEQFSAGKKYCLFHERGIWPSRENRHLFESHCLRAIGTTRFRFSDALEFEDADRWAGISFLQLALEFGWGGLIFVDRLSWFYFSHDAWGVLSVRGEPSPYLSNILDITRVTDPPA